MKGKKRIIIDIKSVMKPGVTQADIAAKMGISPVQLSRIINGVSVKLETLYELCTILNVEPRHILKIQEPAEKERIIPLFLDYSGTTDKLLSGGAQNVKNFFDSIIALEQKTDRRIKIIMVTGSSLGSAKSKFSMLSQLAENSGLYNLFIGVVSEYCGYYSTQNETITLRPISPLLEENKEILRTIIANNNGELQSEVTSFFNSRYDDNISRLDLARVSEELEEKLEQLGMGGDFETITYYDEYGKEIDIKPISHTKSASIMACVDCLRQEYDIDMLIIGGDNQTEDLSMYTENKQALEEQGITSVFIGPSSIEKINSLDNNVIISDWSNVNGIIDALNRLNEKIVVDNEKGITL